MRQRIDARALVPRMRALRAQECCRTPATRTGLDADDRRPSASRPPTTTPSCARAWRRLLGADASPHGGAGADDDAPPSPAPRAPAPTPDCFDTNLGSLRWDYFGCSRIPMELALGAIGDYAGLLRRLLRRYDDDDFSSEDMCCGCGGGSPVEVAPASGTPPPASAPASASTSASRTWGVGVGLRRRRRRRRLQHRDARLCVAGRQRAARDGAFRGRHHRGPAAAASPPCRSPSQRTRDDVLQRGDGHAARLRRVFSEVRARERGGRDDRAIARARPSTPPTRVPSPRRLRRRGARRTTRTATCRRGPRRTRRTTR